jgi:DNA-binding CsgD family transcriptional regulator
MNEGPSIQPPALESLRAALADLLTAAGCEPTQDLISAILSLCGANMLTSRHGDVLQLSIRGMNDKEICDVLGIHPNTLALHWREIRARLGIVTRLQIGAAEVLATCRSTQVAKAPTIIQSWSSKRPKGRTQRRHEE